MRLTDKQRLKVEYNMGKHDGIKEVVEWINNHSSINDYGDNLLLDFTSKWQAKLKKWRYR